MSPIYLVIFFAIVVIFIVAYNFSGAATPKTKTIPPHLLPEYHYSCLYNALVLMAAPGEYLESLSGPGFHPVAELESEFAIGVEKSMLLNNIKNGFINEEQLHKIIQLKHNVGQIESELWKIEHIKAHHKWQQVRDEAESILNLIGEKRRIYDNQFINTITV
jgi:hypothetical protein